MRRAVVTGIGLVTCVGTGKAPFLSAIENSRSGLTPLSLFDTGDYRSHIGGEVKGMPVEGNNRARTFLKLAIEEAIMDSGLSNNLSNNLANDLRHIDIFIGTAAGSLDLWERYYGSQFTSDDGKEFPLWRLSDNIDLPAEDVRIQTISTACTSSTIATGMALWSIRSGKTDVAIVCGVDVLTNFIFVGFDSLRALTPTLCRPFDRDRDGLVLGEGAGVLIVEDSGYAVERGANIYGELAGFSLSSDASNIIAPDPAGRGAAIAVRGAIKDGKTDYEDIDYINLHGTGTAHNDRMECMAMRAVFGGGASQIPMSSIKPIIGHTSGAAGAIEAALCLLCIKYGVIPGTLNHIEPEPDFKDFDFVAGQARQRKVRRALSINSGFGGSNAALLFKDI